MASAESKTRVQSLSRGLKLLEAVIRADKELSNADLDGVLPIKRSSTFRLLRTLVDEDFLRQDPDSKRFSPGPKILDLSGHITQSTRLSRVCHPYLEELTQRTRETSHCAVLHGTQAVLSDHVLSPHVMGVTSTSPRMEPLYCTALGKALLADLENGQLRKLLGDVPFRGYTRNTITSMDGFIEEMERVRKSGVAMDNEEYVDGVRCVAAPVRDASRRCVGAIGISGPTARLNDDALTASSRHVKDVADKLCRHLGYIPG